MLLARKIIGWDEIYLGTIGFLEVLEKSSSRDSRGGDLVLFRSWNQAILAVALVPKFREATTDVTAEGLGWDGAL